MCLAGRVDVVPLAEQAFDLADGLRDLLRGGGLDEDWSTVTKAIFCGVSAIWLVVGHVVEAWRRDRGC